MLNALDVIKGKVVRGGMVAVLVSPNHGAGWSTWARGENVEKCLYDPETVAWVEAGMPDPRPDFESKFGDEFFDGGAEDLVVHWVPIGKRFRIEEYDGAESLCLESDYDWYTA